MSYAFVIDPSYIFDRRQPLVFGLVSRRLSIFSISPMSIDAELFPFKNAAIIRNTTSIL